MRHQSSVSIVFQSGAHVSPADRSKSDITVKQLKSVRKDGLGRRKEMEVQRDAAPKIISTRP